MLSIECAHCGESRVASGGLFCACGPTEQHDLCSGNGCRVCGRWGWLAAFDSAEQVEDCDLLDGDGYFAAMHERYEAREGR